MNQTFFLKIFVTFWVPPFLCHIPCYQTRKLLNLERQIYRRQNKMWAKIHYKISYTSGWETLCWDYFTFNCLSSSACPSTQLFQLTFLGKMTSLLMACSSSKAVLGILLSILSADKYSFLMNLKIFNCWSWNVLLNLIHLYFISSTKN